MRNTNLNLMCLKLLLRKSKPLLVYSTQQYVRDSGLLRAQSTSTTLCAYASLVYKNTAVFNTDEMAEWSKAHDSGSCLHWRGFKSHFRQQTPLFFFWLRTYECLMLLLLLCCSALLSWSLCIAQCQQITLCGSYSMKQLCILNCCLISNCSTATAVCKSSQLTVVPVMMCVRQHMLECVSAVVLLCKLLLASSTVKACTVLACKACSA
jgi:hypothetical protein